MILTKALRRKINTFIIGDESCTLENQFFSTATFVFSSLFTVIAFIVAYYSINFWVCIPIYLTPLIIFYFFYLSRVKRRYKKLSLPFLITGLLCADYFWFIGISFNKGVDLIFPFVLVLGLTFLKVKWHIGYIILNIVNLLIIDFLAYTFPWLNFQYFYPQIVPPEVLTNTHNYIILYIVGISVMLSYLKKNYEYKQLISDAINHKLNNNNQALANRNEHLESLARMVSHNLRSPVAGLKMLLSLYDNMKEPKDKEDIVVNLKQGALQLFDMVEDLSVIMLDYKELNKKRESIELEEVAKSVLTQLAGQIRYTETEISVDFHEYPEVEYSQTYLESIFLNLLSNAIKYSSPERQPEVHIKSFLDGSKVMLEFRDNGLGIDLEKYKDQLFKMYKTFHQLDFQSSKGIGLFITKNQVEMMGGKISVTSEIGKGTSFFIELYRI